MRITAVLAAALVAVTVAFAAMSPTSAMAVKRVYCGKVSLPTGKAKLYEARTSCFTAKRTVRSAYGRRKSGSAIVNGWQCFWTPKLISCTKGTGTKKAGLYAGR